MNSSSQTTVGDVKSMNSYQSSLTKEGKSFSAVMDETISVVDSAVNDEAAITMEALLQGFSPALLISIWTQGQEINKEETGNTELLGKLMMTLNENPNMLNQLLDSAEFQKLLNQMSELLASMNNGLEMTEITNPKAFASSVPIHLPTTKLLAEQTQMILNRFMSVLQQNPDSLLLQQLVVNFQEQLKPLAAQNPDSLILQQLVSNFQEQLKPLTTQKSNKELSVLQNLAVISNEDNPMSKVKSAVADHNQRFNIFSSNKVNPVIGSQTNLENTTPWQLLQENKQTSQLNALLAKSGSVERMVLTSVESGMNAPIDATSELATPSTSAFPLQEMLSIVRSDQVKPTQLVTAQNFVHDMSQFVLKNIKMDTVNGFSEARLTLTPEHLGQVDVKLSMQNGQLVAHFAAQTLLGKELLESQLSQLKLSLQNQGVQVEKLEVTQSSNLQSSLFHEQKHQQFSQGFARQNKSKYGDTEQSTDFSVELANLAQQRAGVYGNAFDVTA